MQSPGGGGTLTDRAKFQNGTKFGVPVFAHECELGVFPTAP